jgi:hypothetical protein
MTVLERIKSVFKRPKEKVRVIEILDVKVYPSENMEHIGVTCAVNLAGLENEEKLFSCHNTSIASPKL